MNYEEHPIPFWITTPNWNSWIKYSPWRIDTLIRDKYRCIDCHNGEGRLIIHHINKDTSNNTPENLVTLCKKCHSIRHGQKKVFVIEKLKQYIPDNIIPSGMLTLISSECEVSRERVRQIAKLNGYMMPKDPLQPHKFKKCIYCMNDFYSNRKIRQFCSSNCHNLYYDQKYWDIYECEQCHLYFKKRRQAMETRMQRFCSKFCQGQWAGNHYGWGNYEINRGRVKYPDMITIAKDFPDGFTNKEFARKYNYASAESTYPAINKLLFQNKIENYRIKGLYRVKLNSPIDFKSPEE
jgi:hypothetical protein